MAALYHEDYSEAGLTTDLPPDEELSRLIETNFASSGKDFSYHIAILRALGLKPGARLLDYGANWGYATLQFQRAGFLTDAFELSVPRATFGKKLGMDIATRPPEGEGIYDAVYSCHVLEHVPNPLQTLHDQLKLVRPGGMVVAHTPNGSADWRRADPETFRSTWGKVHPFLLSAEFLSANFGYLPGYVSSDDRPETVSRWDQQHFLARSVANPGFFFALIRPRTGTLPA